MIKFFFFFKVIKLARIWSIRLTLPNTNMMRGSMRMVCKNFFYPSASMKLARIFQRKREKKKKYRCPFIRIINKRYRRGAERLSRKSHATHGHLYRMCRGWTGKFRKKSLRRVKSHKIGEIKRFSRGNNKCRVSFLPNVFQDIF